LELGNYIEEKLQVEEFWVEEEEFGVIPMSNLTYPESESPRIIQIGTPGGSVKPTTGYAFLNIIRQSKEWADLLLSEEKDRSSAPPRFTFYDNLLLHILQEEGHQASGIFSALFRNNPMHRILTFLSERSHLGQEALIFLRLPFLPFLRALGNRWLGRKIFTGSFRVSTQGKKEKITEAII
jgi:lycopene beta-cyclase